MFTKNWYSVLMNTMMNTGKLDVVKLSGESTGSYYYDNVITGLLSRSFHCVTPTLYKVLTTTSDDGGVIFGTGTTPATVDDYNLSGDFISTLTASVAISTTGDNNSGAVITAVYTLTNTGTSDVTIGEMGLISNSNSTGYANSDSKVLYEHTVLDTPVTIPAGGIGQVTYTIKFNYPTE